MQTVKPRSLAHDLVINFTNCRLKDARHIMSLKQILQNNTKECVTKSLAFDLFYMFVFITGA